MGRKTRLTIQILLASLFVMLLTVFVFTNEFSFSDGSDGPATEEVTAAGLEDGVYYGSADGFGGVIDVGVTVASEEITDIEVLNHSESDGVSDPAFAEVIPAMISNNTTAVDIVSGATFTSEGLMAAVSDALSGEPGEPGDAPTTDGEDADEDTDTDTDGATEEPGDVVYEDGTHTGTADGHNGPLTLEVTVEDGVITDIVVTEHSETDGLTDPAFEEVPAAIIDSNSTEVDVVSNATVSSNAIMTAVRNALGLDAADEDVTYIDGVYEGSTEGHNGPLALEVTVEDGVIANIVVTEHSETEGLTDPAFEEVPAAIMENNSTNVDVVSNATVTSNAIMEAVRDALKDAVE